MSDILDQLKYEFDKRRFDHDVEQASIARVQDRKRYALERLQFRREGAFFYRHSGTMITAGVALAAAFISLGGVWSSWITKTSELELARLRQQTAEAEDALKRDEARLERDRKWRLDALAFVNARSKEIFHGSNLEKQTLRAIMLVSFPPDIAGIVFSSLERDASSDQDRALWREGQQQAERQTIPETRPIPRAATGKEQVALLVPQLGGDARRQASDRLISLYPSNKQLVVSSVIASLLPQSDPRSYRQNLYALVTLARLPERWESTATELDSIKSVPITQTSNYADPTFRKWTDAAINNANTPPKVIVAQTAGVASSVATGPVLVKATFTSVTEDDDKDNDTGVFVGVQTSDGALSLAAGENLDSANRAYKDGSTNSIELRVIGTATPKIIAMKFRYFVGSKAVGNDRWILRSTSVTLHFSDGTSVLKSGGRVELNSRGSAYVQSPWFGQP